MRRFVTLAFFIIISCKESQEPSVSIEIQEVEVSDVQLDKYLETKIEFINNGETSVLFYSLDDTIKLGDKELLDCTSEISVGIGSLFFDKDMNYIPFELESGKAEHLIPSYVQNVYKVSKSSYPDVVVLKPKKQLKINRVIDITELNEPQNAAYLSLIYFSGNYFDNIIDKHAVSKDKSRFEAEVFKGCLVSNLYNLKEFRKNEYPPAVPSID